MWKTHFCVFSWWLTDTLFHSPLSYYTGCLTNRYLANFDYYPFFNYSLNLMSLLRFTSSASSIRMSSIRMVASFFMQLWILLVSSNFRYFFCWRLQHMLTLLYLSYCGVLIARYLFYFTKTTIIPQRSLPLIYVVWTSSLQLYWKFNSL